MHRGYEPTQDNTNTLALTFAHCCALLCSLFVWHSFFFSLFRLPPLPIFQSFNHSRTKLCPQPSQNSCNRGSYHAWLPLDNPRPRERRGEAARANGYDDSDARHSTELQPASCLLLRKLAALPALIAPHYPGRLAVPPLIQLGYFPPDNSAAYRPHLDHWPHEARNKRELTLLLYVNVGWDSQQCGGSLRIHSSESRDPFLPLAPSTTFDVEPLAGRLVIFQSRHCMHEVLPSRLQGRLALTLWVERQEEDCV